MLDKDIQAKKDGYIVKYSFWVHSKFGDDYCNNVYRSKKFTKKEVQNYIDYIKANYDADLVEYPIVKNL